MEAGPRLEHELSYSQYKGAQFLAFAGAFALLPSSIVTSLPRGVDDEPRDDQQALSSLPTDRSTPLLTLTA